MHRPACILMCVDVHVVECDVCVCVCLGKRMEVRAVRFGGVLWQGEGRNNEEERKDGWMDERGAH